MTREQLRRCALLEDKDGMIAVGLPIGPDTPIPGLMIYVDMGHQRLLMVQGDGSTVDLLAVHRLAEDCVRNWQKGSSLPGFVGDFRRLTPLAEALNGSPLPTEEPS